MEEARNVDPGEPVPQSPMLPPEILHLVAQHIISPSIVERDRETVKTCSLVFSGWRIPFQRALFKITKPPYLLFSEFTENAERRRIDKLRDLLNANPDFQKAITSIRLRLLGTGILPGSTPEFTASLLSELKSVDTVAICQNQQHHPTGIKHTWTSLSEEVQAAVSALFRSPSIRHVYIQSFDAPLGVTFPEGGERDTVRISCSRSPDLVRLEDDSHLVIDSDLATIMSCELRPCVVRQLTSMLPIASKLLRAAHASQSGIKAPFVDSFATHSLELEVEEKSGGLVVQDLRGVLHRTTNLRKLTVWGPGDYIDGLFHDPQPACLASSLELIDFTFSGITTSSPNSDSATAVKLVNLLRTAFLAYPSPNVLKNVTLTIPSFKSAYTVSLAGRLGEGLVKLGDLFGRKERFPFLECVEVIPELSVTGYGMDWYEGDGRNMEYRIITEVLEEVMMEARKMGPGFKFSVCMSEGDSEIVSWRYSERVDA